MVALIYSPNSETSCLSEKPQAARKIMVAGTFFFRSIRAKTTSFLPTKNSNQEPRTGRISALHKVLPVAASTSPVK